MKIAEGPQAGTASEDSPAGLKPGFRRAGNVKTFENQTAKMLLAGAMSAGNLDESAKSSKSVDGYHTAWGRRNRGRRNRNMGVNFGLQYTEGCSTSASAFQR